jgi:hypothetical protein
MRNADIVVFQVSVPSQILELQLTYDRELGSVHSLRSQGSIKFNNTGIPPHFLRLPEIGITLISPDYRLAPQADIFSIVKDAISAVDYIRTALPQLVGMVDPSRLALSGGSAGGWLGTYCVLNGSS